MLSGTVLIAHHDPIIRTSIEQILTAMNPGIHVEGAMSGSEALEIRSIMRPQVVVLGIEQKDMTGEHLICELKRDIVNPYILAIGKNMSASECRKLIGMGASEIMQEPINIVKAAEWIGEHLKNGERKRKSMPEATLQRLFADTGIPFDLKGYRYLKYALSLLESGAAQLEPIAKLYERIGEKYSCMPSSVERNIRYAISLCESRMEEGRKIGNRQFIARLMEQNDPRARIMCAPRVSVFCSGRRLFR